MCTTPIRRSPPAPTDRRDGAAGEPRRSGAPRRRRRPGILLAAIGIGSPPSGPATGCGVLDAVRAGLVGSHVALAAANLTLGLAFPALLPAAAAAVSAALLPRGRPAGLAHVAFAVLNAAILRAIASVPGFAPAEA